MFENTQKATLQNTAQNTIALCVRIKRVVLNRFVVQFRTVFFIFTIKIKINVDAMLHFTERTYARD